jgi:hypothetical protein
MVPESLDESQTRGHASTCRHRLWHWSHPRCRSTTMLDAKRKPIILLNISCAVYVIWKKSHVPFRSTTFFTFQVSYVRQLSIFFPSQSDQPKIETHVSEHARDAARTGTATRRNLPRIPLYVHPYVFITSRKKSKTNIELIDESQIEP